VALECVHLLCGYFDANFPVFYSLAIVLVSLIVIFMINWLDFVLSSSVCDQILLSLV